MKPSKPAEPADDGPLERALRSSRVLIDAPEAVIERAVALFEPQAAHAAARPGLLRRLAELRFDSAGAAPLAFGMRASGGTVRQLLYSLEGRDIDLRIEPEADIGLEERYALSGQILGPASAGVVVIEPEAGGDASAAVLNELGEFRLPAVAPGSYHVTLELSDMAIDLPVLRVPQSA
jgi:hypothetical protein